MGEKKLHYKMYKDGKKFVFVAIATLSFFVFGGVSTVAVHADTTSGNLTASDSAKTDNATTTAAAGDNTKTDNTATTTDTGNSTKTDNTATTADTGNSTKTDNTATTTAVGDSAKTGQEQIEFYNNRRIRTKLKGKSPVQYRELANQLVA